MRETLRKKIKNQKEAISSIMWDSAGYTDIRLLNLLGKKTLDVSLPNNILLKALEDNIKQLEKTINK